MTVRYVKLWKRLLDMGLKRTDLISQAGISSNVLAKLGRDEFVAMESISKICKALNCDVGDISSNVLAKLGRDEFVAMESISKICKALN